ncbi:hypothetical protein TNCV_1218101 [Trichonephila clavipes]|nr:hypothetical protein TNCV_1218101 [Trichonephila clavipes]
MKYGSLRGDKHIEGGSRGIRTSSMVQNVLDTVRRYPSISVQAVRRSSSSDQRVLQQHTIATTMVCYTHTIVKEYRHILGWK